MTIIAFLASTYSPARLASRLNIATSTWSRIKSGVSVPTPGILGRITSTYRAIQYNRLTAAGFSPSIAKGMKAFGPDKISYYIGKMNELTSIINTKHGVDDINSVRRAIRNSKLDWEELEYRIREGISWNSEGRFFPHTISKAPRDPRREAPNQPHRVRLWSIHYRQAIFILHFRRWHLGIQTSSSSIFLPEISRFRLHRIQLEVRIRSYTLSPSCAYPTETEIQDFRSTRRVFLQVLSA